MTSSTVNAPHACFRGSLNTELTLAVQLQRCGHTCVCEKPRSSSNAGSCCIEKVQAKYDERLWLQCRPSGYMYEALLLGNIFPYQVRFIFVALPFGPTFITFHTKLLITTNGTNPDLCQLFESFVEPSVKCFLIGADRSLNLVLANNHDLFCRGARHSVHNVVHEIASLQRLWSSDPYRKLRYKQFDINAC